MKLEGISSLTMNNDINNTEEKQWVEIAICKKNCSCTYLH